VIFEDESNLKQIDESAFAFSGLKSIVIPRSVEVLGKHCFSWCKSLIEVIFEDEGNLERSCESAFGHSAVKAIRIPNSIECLGKSCFWECHSLFEDDCSLNRIDDFAFASSGLNRFSFLNQLKFLEQSVLGIANR
jgi:hypothetical protein